MINISSNILQSLIISPDHTYHIKSNVSKNAFQSLLDYLIDDTMPTIDFNNINEFIELSDEFEILSKVINDKKEEFGEYLINLNALQFHRNMNGSKYEEEIAENLDVYIENYGSALMKIPIQSLYNIFNHKQRKLTKHNQAYEVFKKEFESTNDLNIFILLESIDGTQLTKSNLEESLALRNVRNNHMPTTDFKYLATLIENQNEFKKRIIELESKIENDEQNHHKEIESLMKQINENEIKNEEKLKSIEEKYKNEIEILNQKIDSLTNLINENKIENENSIKTIQIAHQKEKDEFNKDIRYKFISIANYFHSAFKTEMSLSTPGILGELKKREKNQFDHLFISSQSSRDIYNLIDPSTKDTFSTSNTGDFYIEFELKEAVTMTGFKIFTSNVFFPKSFKIEINGEIVKTVDDANELNGSFKDMTVVFEPVQSQKIRIIQTGPNWDKGSNFLHFKRFELLSNEEKYSKGVFSTLVSESENCDPHKCGVYISSLYFDFNDIHIIDAKNNIATGNKKNQWFQIELTKGVAVLIGFRLKKGIVCALRKFEIIATDDSNTPIDSWTKLIEINENDENEHKIIDIYQFPELSPPVKFIRLVQTGKNWSNDHFLTFHHFDLFGTYF